ncbi:MAG: hypothetical protein H6825_00910 [Planctomycetes bacterium]|nr:hypothetical protein [Planctomycetota bacterium]
MPFSALFVFSTDALGGVSLPFTWPAALPPATEIYYQIAVQDGAAVQGVALSNALQSIAP